MTLHLSLYITFHVFSFTLPLSLFSPFLSRFRCFFVILHFHQRNPKMYQTDEHKGLESSLQPPLMIKPNNASISRFDTSQISIFQNPNKFFSDNNNNLHSYLPLHDLTSLNPTTHHAAGSPSISTILSQDSEGTTTAKEQDEEQEMRRLKRMISNRESARRSRMRKRKQLENLQSQVLQLLAANHQLAEKLNHVMESNYQILQENARLREESFSLRKSVADLLASMKNGLEEDPACSRVLKVFKSFCRA